MPRNQQKSKSRDKKTGSGGQTSRTYGNSNPFTNQQNSATQKFLQFYSATAGENIPIEQINLDGFGKHVSPERKGFLERVKAFFTASEATDSEKPNKGS